MAVSEFQLRTFARPAWLPAKVWPFETLVLDVEGFRIAVSEVGRGPALLFYTGIGSFIWRDVMMRLSGDFRCITIDPPGIGLSTPIPRSEATLERSARSVVATIDALDLQNLTLVVHDSGGPPAFAAAGRRAARVRGLVGVNTFGWRPSGAAFRGMLAVMGSSGVRQFSLRTGALARLTATSFGVGRHLNEESRRAYRAGLQKSMSAFHDYLNDARRSDLYDEVARAITGPLARLPLLTIFGEHNDPLKFQPQWKARFPTARQLVVRKGNHFPMCDAPDFVADEIRRWYHAESGSPPTPSPGWSNAGHYG
jgi:pimeloyl-ACP methyl ester carboxylesterase